MPLVGFCYLWNRFCAVFKLSFYQVGMPFLVWLFAIWNDRVFRNRDDDKMGGAHYWKKTYAWECKRVILVLSYAQFSFLDRKYWERVLNVF